MPSTRVLVALLLITSSLGLAQAEGPEMAGDASPEQETALPDIVSILETVEAQTGCGQGLLGGYFSVEDLSNVNLYTYAALALREYANIEENAAELAACRPNLAEAKRSIRVDAACEQIVSGTNYVIAFYVNIPCHVSGASSTETELLAKIYEPLPSADNAASPQVVSVERLLKL